jgi:hypothetical protein
LSENRPARQPGPSGYQAEDENTIYFGRPSGPAAAAERGRTTSARVRERQFSQPDADFGQSSAAGPPAEGREFGQKTAADARPRGDADADRASDDDSPEATLDGSAESELDAELNARRQQLGPAEPSSPSRTQEKPRKRGLFSWFRGRDKTESR